MGRMPALTSNTAVNSQELRCTPTSSASASRIGRSM
jgi:hypothetical protein